MSNRTAEASRAVAQAWKMEQILVLGGRGTRDWTPEQQRDILEKGRAYDENGKAIEGHHMKNAENYPESQGDPNNIQFLTRKEHQDAPNGYFRNPTCGYYDPISGITTVFEDEVVIPCPIIQLSDPTEYHRNLGTLDEYEQSKASSVEEKMSMEEYDEESREIVESLLSRDDETNKLSRMVRPFVLGLKDFVKDNPEVVVNWGAAVATTVINIATKSPSNLNTTAIKSVQDSSAIKEIVKNNLVEAVVENVNQSGSHSSPVEHIVKAHGQHYGKNKVWIEKAPYTRGGKK